MEETRVSALSDAFSFGLYSWRRGFLLDISDGFCWSFFAPSRVNIPFPPMAGITGVWICPDVIICIFEVSWAGPLSYGGDGMSLRVVFF